MRFIEAVKERPVTNAIFMTLYYIGMREGELLALTPADIDLEKQTIRINKSFQRLKGQIRVHDIRHTCASTNFTLIRQTILVFDCYFD